MNIDAHGFANLGWIDGLGIRIVPPSLAITTVATPHVQRLRLGKVATWHIHAVALVQFASDGAILAPLPTLLLHTIAAPDLQLGTVFKITTDNI